MGTDNIVGFHTSRPHHASPVEQIPVMQVHAALTVGARILVQVLDAASVERRAAADDAVDLRTTQTHLNHYYPPTCRYSSTFTIPAINETSGFSTWSGVVDYLETPNVSLGFPIF